MESSLAYVRNSLIGIYCKCGFLEEVAKVFERCSNRDVVTCNVMMMGWIKACNRNELVNQGFKYYTCMVDLLGQAGCLDEAMQVIDAMPIHPDSSVWGSLLAACRKFSNLELSRKVAQNLFMIELHNFGNYVCIAWNVGRS
ncbi:hypothetical protein ZIOFF_014891 [Zingiber officinale]|uniref:Pentatricopeptide repeat-containing protein n=2 Tax=Zingiber officinale TaxID=94328 RepID=A0A8J5HCB4_ZINOF|nr:hypothetical protein ZIOFF_014891 [Zingiber officinale]